MEAMDFEGVRCAPLLTKAFSAHIDLRAREAAARGDEAGDDAVAELTLLASWVSEQRERQEERDDAARRRQRQQTGGGGGTDAAVASNDESVSFPTPLRTAGDKFASLMAAAANGVDALRAEIVRMAEAREVDDALMAILTGNAANAEAEGDAACCNGRRGRASACHHGLARGKFRLIGCYPQSGGAVVVTQLAPSG